MRKKILWGILIASILLNIVLATLLISHKIADAEKYRPYNNLRPRIEQQIISDYLKHKREQ